MYSKAVKQIKSFGNISVQERHKEEFNASINKSNVVRAKITAATFIIMETIVLIVSIIIRGHEMLKRPGSIYLFLYILMIGVMSIFYFIFTRLGKNFEQKSTDIMIAGILFTSFILLWCSGISLMDQMSRGQIIVYVTAIVAVAVTPFFKPLTLILIYLPVHIVFIACMFSFEHFSSNMFGNSVNSTTILIISLVISYIRYKARVEEFNNRKIIQEKQDELARVNKELEQANHKLEKLSQTDSLTGISNRAVFDRSIKIEWDRCRRHFVPLSLIMIDIDFFKAFNDNYGHQSGDECLRKVAKVLSDNARRSSDVASRYGGEEFAVILPDMSREAAIKLAEKMRHDVEKLNIVHEYSATSEHLTISLVVYTATPSDKSSADEFIRIADKALYEAKNENRNNTVSA